MGKSEKGRVCVIGGTGFVGSCLVKRLLEDGYSVNRTTRNPGASKSPEVFGVDFDKPASFTAAIEGCSGVFLVAHPMDINKEPETKATERTKGILQACVNSKTVKRVVYTSSLATVAFLKNDTSQRKDEGCWTDVEHVRRLKLDLGSYFVSKTLTEKAALKFAEENKLDLVTVIPSLIHGAFICPDCPISVGVAMALAFANESHHPLDKRINIVDVDDLVRAHIHLLKCKEAEGRYICSHPNATIDKKLYEFLSKKYSEYKLTPEHSEESKKLLAIVSQYKNVLKTMPIELLSADISSKKLQDTGFKYQNGLEKMFEGAISSCKERGLL